MMQINFKLFPKSIKFKLILFSILTAVIPTAIVGISMVNISVNTIQRVAYNFVSQLIVQISEKIDNNIKEVERISFNIISNQEMLDILAESSRNSGLSYEESSYIEEMLTSQTHFRNDINGIYLFSNNGEVFYSPSSPSLEIDYDISKESWYKKVRMLSGRFFLLPADYPQRYLKDSSEPILSFIRIVNDYRTDTSIGTLIIDLKLKMIRDALYSIDISKIHNILVIDSDGKFITSNRSGEIKTSDELDMFQYLSGNRRIMDGKSGNFIEIYNREQMLATFFTSPYTKWKYISFIPVSELSDGAIAIKVIIVFIGFIAVFATFIITAFIGLKIFKPIKKLQDGMKKVDQNNFDVIVDVTADDEIGDLCNTFNGMIRRLNELINTVYKLEAENREIELKKKVAELNVLQAQINPHFLYNTLESISMMAKINDDHETQKMAVALGKLLRLSISKGETMVSVAQEIEHVENYLVIQKTRFDDKFDVVFDIDDRILRCKTLKLILQPLVENAIYHGIETKRGKGTIEIKGLIENDEIVFYINDDGVGMTDERLKEMEEIIGTANEEEFYTSRNIGLSNVNQRIKLHFRDNKYGIKIKSSKNEGTSIRINLPMIEE